MKWKKAKKQVDAKAWADLELRPTGRVTTKEQYDYVLNYGKHTGIAVDGRYIHRFAAECGKYLRLGSRLGGDGCYFYFSKTPEDGREDFSYGKFGKIDFHELSESR